MKAQVLIIRGTKANLQRAYKLLVIDREVRSLTLYKIGARYRMMLGGWLNADQVAEIAKDDSLKITQFIPTT